MWRKERCRALNPLQNAQLATKLHQIWSVWPCLTYQSEQNAIRIPYYRQHIVQHFVERFENHRDVLLDVLSFPSVLSRRSNAEVNQVITLKILELCGGRTHGMR